MSGEHKTVIKGNSSKYVKLNVGGSLHYTTIGTLTKQDTMLRAMFSGRMEVLTDSEGWILIDRNGQYFGYLLNFLRDGTVALPESRRELLDLLQEAKYFLVQDLVKLVEAHLKRLGKDDVEPKCRIPLITSQREEQSLIATTVRLFDRLALRFSGRVLFLKDVLGSSEICCWSFYGHNQKIAEVCCTSIVYGEQKKHTKVEFPEAKIFEEALNCLLYENRHSRPDLELMEATRMGSGASASQSDEEIEEMLDRMRTSNNRK
ncbi:BACD3-like protein [Mya arenaria]|uniref:BACD3-like protein n=1 Tax=Mya arenaria TaxID=6604 RepID=A0ABY7E311_MYAAR|nr:BACD3-like protein [Mya arenaria]